MIDDPKAYQELVSPADWKILGADELNEKNMQKNKHEKWLKENNMPLPPKSKKKKKRKRKTAASEDQEGKAGSEESEEDDIIEDDDEEDAIDKAI